MAKIPFRAQKILTNSLRTHEGIRFEKPNLAKLTNGSSESILGDTHVLVTVVTEKSKSNDSNINFVPLSVEYKQKAAAAGRIPLTNIRRDLGFSEIEILTGRMIDRSVRPAIPKGFTDSTQIICNLLSVDGHHDPDILAINGASASLSVSDIPWLGPIGAVRMGLVGDNFVCNPTRQQQTNSRLNIVIAANQSGNITMLDGSCNEPLSNKNISSAIRRGLKECNLVIESIKDLETKFGKPKRVLEFPNEPSKEQIETVHESAGRRLDEIFHCHDHNKQTRDDAITELRSQSLEIFKEKYEGQENVGNYQVKFQIAFEKVVRRVYTTMLYRDHIRCDGRSFKSLRPITCNINMYKPLHGSAIFQRGQTQVFCSTTLDSPDTAIRTDPISLLISGIRDRHFMLHYEFPNYATNEIKHKNRIDRREIGHGALAEKALKPLVPTDRDMTIRLNCEVLESNGSSSMASVCAGSMSLMDASVDIKEHVAGISIGLFGDDTMSLDSILLTDILGFEDYIGDMDFKVAGTRDGITAVQLDVKPIHGVPSNLIVKALQHAQEARVKIINLMSKQIDKPRAIKKDNHPVMKTIHVPAYKKSKFIGVGGANLKKLVAQIGVKVTLLDESLDDHTNTNDKTKLERGNVQLFAPNQEAMTEAEEFINQLLEKEYREPELNFNGIYTATIEEIRPHGVMVTLFPNMPPTMLALSQLDIRKVTHPSALNLEVGQKIQVKYFGRDPVSGQMRLSRKSLQMTNDYGPKDHHK